MSVAERLWSRVDRSDPEACWLWPGAHSQGYGRVKGDVRGSCEGRMLQAHRVAWELTNGPIAEGMVLDHMCHQLLCINPRHLREVTHAQNMQNRKGPTKRSKTGIAGVQFRAGKYQVVVAGRYVGRFAGLDDAAAAADEARKTFMPFSVHKLQVTR